MEVSHDRAARSHDSRDDSSWILSSDSQSLSRTHDQPGPSLSAPGRSDHQRRGCQYLAHLLMERKVSWSSCNQAACAFRFFYHATLGRSASEFEVPAPRQPQKLPEILSREEVWRLLEAPANLKHRLLLATIYAAGVRVGEAGRLRISPIDTERMTIRIEQGKGAKDRY